LRRNARCHGRCRLREADAGVSAEFYYFSGTGNSLAIARGLAAECRGKLIPIPPLMDLDHLEIDGDVVGIVFGVQHGAPPLIVQRFVSKLAGLEGRYLVGICTYGDGPGLAIEYLGRALRSRGGGLAAGFAVHMPYNYLTPSFTLRKFRDSFVLRQVSAQKQQALLADSKNRIEQIAEFIGTRGTGTYETAATRITRVTEWLGLEERFGKRFWLRVAGVAESPDLSFLDSRQLMDRGFHWDQNCNGCGICSRICPRGDIEMIEARPVWHQHCEQCFACLQWCPREAIQFRGGTSGRRRYHHPDVSLADMLGHAHGG
jgi:ferredoxin